MKYVLKALTFVFVCSITWKATSLLMAGPPQRTIGLMNSEGTSEHPAPTPLLSRATKMEPVSSVIHMPKSTMVVRDGNAHLSAVASISTDQRDRIYVWGLQIFDGAGVQLHSFIYADQLFDMEPDGQMEPEFDDTFPLPPGASHVALTLYRLPKQVGLAALKSDVETNQYVVVRTVKQVSN